MTLLSSLITLTIYCILTSIANVIITDDQDITVNQGLTFTNSFISSPICCVSRSSIMSGRYVHNHRVHNNSLNGGCSNTIWQSKIEPTCLAVHIKNAGYTTFYNGKYLNNMALKMLVVLNIYHLDGIIGII